MKKVLLGATLLLIVAATTTNSIYAQRGRGGMRGFAPRGAYMRGYGFGFGYGGYGYGYPYYGGYPYYYYNSPYSLYYNPLTALYMYWNSRQWLFSSMVPPYMSGAPVGQWDGNAQRIAALQRKIDAMNRDSDGDGVPDYYDKCPNTPQGAPVDGSGCPLPPQQIIHDTVTIAPPPAPAPVVTQDDKAVVDEAIKDLQFDVNKATIRPESFASLNRVANLLVNKNYDLSLSGNTDNTGDFDANMRLSKARADAVKQYLVNRGADPSRIDAAGYGSTRPIADNDTPEGRQQNRRVEFTLH